MPVRAKAMPQVFWDWAQWRDQLRRNPKLPMPQSVVRYFYAHGLKRAPVTWRTRYEVHRGIKAPRPPVVKKIQTTTPDPRHPLTHLFKWPMICAESPEVTFNQGVPSKYTYWLTADPAYRHNYTGPVIDYIKTHHGIGAWCNPAQVPVSELRAFAKDLGIPSTMLLGQFETEHEFDMSWEGGLIAGVGNISALRPDQKSKIRNNQFIAQVEDYWNVMPWMQLNFEGLPTACTVKGIYPGQVDSATYGRYLDPTAYFIAGRWAPGDGVYHANGPASAGHPADIGQLSLLP